MIAGDEKSERTEGSVEFTSVRFVSWRPFHGENTGSIPVGRARVFKNSVQTGSSAVRVASVLEIRRRPERSATGLLTAPCPCC